MIYITKTISTAFDDLKRRIVKVLVSGKDNVQTATEVSPYGIDSNPIKDMYAIYAPTETKGKKVIVGYINVEKLAATGEVRLFSTNDSGALQTFIWLKKDGIIEIGGDQNFAVRFNELKSGYDSLKNTVNDLIGKWNAFTAAYVPGSPASVGTPPTLAGQNVTPSSASIDSAKNENIKTS